MKKLVLHLFKTIIHPGEVNGIRELPQNSKIVATHTEIPHVLIWDVEAQPNRHAVLGAADSHPDLILAGHQDQENAEFALAMCPIESFVLSGGKDKLVVLWSICDHFSTSATDTSSTKSPGTPSGGSILKQTSKTSSSSEKAADDPSIGPRGVYQGHEDTVEDVQFYPSSSQVFCIVGDHSCLILWDAHVGSTPSVKVEKARNADLYCVDWNPHDENFILTGSADNSVHMFDRQNLTPGALDHLFTNFKATKLLSYVCRLVKRKNVLERGCQTLLQDYFFSMLGTEIKWLIFTGMHQIHGPLLVHLMTVGVLVEAGHCRYGE